MTILFVGIGGAAGALSRYLVSLIPFTKRKQFPWPTLIVNIVGSLLLGMVVYYYVNDLLPLTLWYTLGIGFCGAFTTFSTFGVETILLIEENRIISAIIYVISTISMSIFAFILGNTL